MLSKKPLIVFSWNTLRRAVLQSGLAAIVLAALPAAVRAQDAAEMARKLQDPLANISAVMTDSNETSPSSVP